MAARITHACVDVTHAVRAITGEIVMDLYQMVLYVKTVKVLDRNCNITDKRDNNVVCLYFGNNDTLYTQERLEHYKNRISRKWLNSCMFMSELLGQSHHKQMVLLKKKITVMSQGQMVDFVKIRKAC